MAEVGVMLQGAAANLNQHSLTDAIGFHLTEKLLDRLFPFGGEQVAGPARKFGRKAREDVCVRVDVRGSCG
jgi:hypothetical protein